jgi:hypothetical protein
MENDMRHLDLTPLERQILDRSDKPEVTRQRRTIVIASGLSFAAVLVAMALVKRSWQFVLGIALVYIAITIWEKVAYANAVLAYKSLIQKLKKRIEETEPKESSEPEAGGYRR